MPAQLHCCSQSEFSSFEGAYNSGQAARQWPAPCRMFRTTSPPATRSISFLQAIVPVLVFTMEHNENAVGSELIQSFLVRCRHCSTDIFMQFVSHSQIPQLIRHTSPTKRLEDITGAEANARTSAPMAPLAQLSSSKHPLANRSWTPQECVMVRLTNKTPAAEPALKKKKAEPGSPTRNNGCAATSTMLTKDKFGFGAKTAGSHDWTQQFSSSTSTRSNSSMSRNMSNGSSMSSSMNTGARPQSIQNLNRTKAATTQRREMQRASQFRAAAGPGGRGSKVDNSQIQGRSISNQYPQEVRRLRRARTSILAPPKTPSKVPVKCRSLSGVKPMVSRDASLSVAMEGLNLSSSPSRETVDNKRCTRPLESPAPFIAAPPLFPLSPYVNMVKGSPRKFEQFLTRDSNTKAWDTRRESEAMNTIFEQFSSKMHQTYTDVNGFKEANDLYKAHSTFYPEICDLLQSLLSSGVSAENVIRLTYLYVHLVTTLEKARTDLTETNTALRSELETANYRVTEAEKTRGALVSNHEASLESLQRQHRSDVEKVKEDARNDLERLKDDHRQEIRDIRQRLEGELDKERSQRIQAVSQLSTQGALDQQRRHIELEAKEQEIRGVKTELERLLADMERERAVSDELRQNLSTASTSAATIESSRQGLQAKVEYLESDSKSQSEAYAHMEQQMRDAIQDAQKLQEKLRAEETQRRKLHNQIQELRGNIRVFCRVRPSLGVDANEEQAKIAYPDGGDEGKEIEVRGAEEKSSLGTVTTKKYPFTFDRVFGPTSQNQEIFDEISQMIQSALDGFNVCIFCYGQTGSGKTYTMSSEDGMIPRAVHMIYDQTQSLEERGWRYEMQGSFIEVYNEGLNDLLGKSEEFDKKKHEIRHDPQTCTTHVTDMTSVELDSAQKVEQILAQAMANRSVAATKANQRSSRSHSVFILRLSGRNDVTGEHSEGTLNLVDLAGSERLSQSKVAGARLKETQNINRSLSCLGDVIGALGQQSQGQSHNGARDNSGGNGGNVTHVPYRNSKLTYLLQYSLGGNSKTLMFCMVSPLEAHLAESLTSLRFATKVSPNSDTFLWQMKPLLFSFSVSSW